MVDDTAGTDAVLLVAGDVSGGKEGLDGVHVGVQAAVIVQNGELGVPGVAGQALFLVPEELVIGCQRLVQQLLGAGTAHQNSGGSGQDDEGVGVALLSGQGLAVSGQACVPAAVGGVMELAMQTLQASIDQRFAVLDAQHVGQAVNVDHAAGDIGLTVALDPGSAVVAQIVGATAGRGEAAAEAEQGVADVFHELLVLLGVQLVLALVDNLGDAVGEVADDGINAQVHHPADVLFLVDGPGVDGNALGLDVSDSLLIQADEAGMEAVHTGALQVLAHVQQPGLGQQAALHVGAQLLHALDGVVVEGRDDDTVLQAVLIDQIQDLLLDAGILEDAGLQLDVGDDVVILHQIEVLPQGGDALEAVLILVNIRSVKGFDLCEGKVLHKAGDIVAGTVHFLVVDDHALAVAGQLDIHLNAVASGRLAGHLEGQQSVLRIQAAETSVCKIFNHCLPPW